MKARTIDAKDKNAISIAVSVLKRSGVIIYPTESSYGIGADATSENAIRRVCRMKGRKNKPISIIVSSVKMARYYAHLDKEASLLAGNLMPGRLTLVVKKKKNLPDILSKDTIGFRIPPHEFFVTLVKKFGKPITATSANKAGLPALYRIRDVVKTFGDSADLIIDAGNLSKRKTSTVYDVVNKRIIRKGPVKETDIEKCLKA